MKHRYSWIKDKKDIRDFKYENRIEGVGLTKLPVKIDLTKHCSSIENQEQIGSCTANALVGNMEFLEKKDSKKPTDLSRLFIYFNERAIEGDINEDRGASLRDGIKALHKFGVCDEENWPYKPELVLEKPSPVCYTQAVSRCISSYESLKTLGQMKDCLASGFPFVFGFQVYSAFESGEVAETGELNMPAVTETLLGGHAVLAVGYDDSIRRIVVRNSWGKAWGKNGYFTMPYDYLENDELSSDFWTIKN